RAILAGTGYGDGGALATAEYHSDGGIVRTWYDVFGDARLIRDELGRDQTLLYDAKGRLIQHNRANGLIEYFAYDCLGQRIQHWNNVLQTPVYGPPEQVWVEDPPYWDPYYGWVYPGGHWETHTPIVGYAPLKELTDYDMQGRVTRQVAFGGDTTTTSYAWNGGLATAGMGTFGGWTETTTYANGRTLVEQSDVHGRLLVKTDLGGHVYSFSYDLAGRAAQRGGNGETVTFGQLNTGRTGQVINLTGSLDSTFTRKTTTYGYDANGNLTSEALAMDGQQEDGWYDEWGNWYPYITSWSRSYKNATASYDALNRIVSWTDSGGTDMPAASTTWEYDLTSNIRRSRAEYRSLDHNGTPSSYVSVQDNWYRYDAMNRVVTKGSLSGGQIVRSSGGFDHLYNAAGERVSTTRTVQRTGQIHNPWYEPDPYYGYGGDPFITVWYDADTREDYTYDSGGTLATVRISEGYLIDHYDGTYSVAAPGAYAALKATHTHDQLGRLTRQVDWLSDGSNAAYDRTVTYNEKGQVASESIVSKQGWDTIQSSVSNDFGYGANYALGAVVGVYTTTLKNGAWQGASTTSNQYAWYDSAVQSRIIFQPNTSNWTTHNTYFGYDASGALTSVSVQDGRPRGVTIVNDGNGQAIRRDESDYNWNQGDPHEIWFRFGGKQLGYTGNNGTLDTDYQTSIDNRTRTPGNGAFRFGQGWGTAHADFDLSGEAINSYGQGSAGGSYTVRTGDSLSSIAASLWGDSSLWYKLAEANGMSAANALVEGQRLTIPAGILKSQHNAGTLRPYDPGEAIGDVSPTTPQPQRAAPRRGGRCGIF
ncbi:MAG TPA: LysM peptidoglycan-binding domain-containing protein, partial [Allosphingosinicella sp.]|nr:LysM peptidoglycan-binding domain-containing protein [Allosphingosinicella sp.]